MPLSLPAHEATWTFLACQRISYSSVVQVTREIIFTVVKRLIAQGYTIRGSCDGVTGAMDAVDRWPTAVEAGVRSNGVNGVQSWFVLRDADGADIVFSYNAATDDVYNVWVSFSGLVIANATNSAFEPTATDQCLTNKFYTTTPGTIANSATSLDRLVSVWTRSDQRGFRFAVARNGGWVSRFSKDRYSPAVYAAGITLHPGFAFYENSQLSTGNSNRMFVNALNTASNPATSQFLTRTKRTDGAGFILDCSRYLKYPGQAGDAADNIHAWSGVQPELQGAASYALRRVGLWSVTTSHRGDVGRTIDWYLGRTGGAEGDTYGSLEWIVMDSAHGLLWPWDGTTVVSMA